MKHANIMKTAGLVALSGSAGAAALLVHQLLFQPGEPRADAYYFSHYAAQNYTWVTAVLFAILGALLAFRTRASPWAIGFSMVIVFPLVTLAEAIADSTSHNLMPFELATHAAFAVPAVAGAFLGGWLAHRN